jgi:DNA excision repair protein ERCC-4
LHRWAKCDPEDPNWNPWGGNYWPQYPIAYGESAAAADMAMPEMAATATVGSAKEDSYGTNNQVEGVDEADIVKSDGIHVFAAYGDLLYAWNATDGTTGTSVTPMPYNKTNCTDGPMPIIEPFVYYDYEDELVENSTDTVADSSSSTSTGSSSEKKIPRRQQSERQTMSMPYYPHCYQPKPQILSLLLHGSHLTAVVSENNYMIQPYSTEMPSLINDYSTLTIRVYDVSTVPTDGSPLTLLGERKLKGNYNAARSIENTGVVVTTSYVDTNVMANSLYRSQPLYCGLNNTQYEEKAAKIAVNRSEVFAEQLIKELDLNYGCQNIFQISAMQSGNSSSDSTNGDLLSNFVSVISFNTAANNYVDEEIPIKLSGSFASGYLSDVYVSQDFVAALAVGSSYNPNTTSWDQSTFILGFDISNPTPVPYSFGQVPGSPINQYSADLFDDHFRIATTEWQWSEADSTSRTTNQIFVLDLPTDADSNDASMKVIGQTDHLGKPNESIYSVRFIEDKAYVVTFEQKDPFIVIDLSNATDPRPIGELELPGYSSYLHPIEIDGVKLILGVGQDVNETTGWTTGVKISLFNITDPENPVETFSFVDQNAYSNAQHDFHSFRYLPLTQKLILPQSEYTWTSEGNFDGFIIYDVAVDEIRPSYNSKCFCATLIASPEYLVLQF